MSTFSSQAAAFFFIYSSGFVSHDYCSSTIYRVISFGSSCLISAGVPPWNVDAFRAFSSACNLFISISISLGDLCTFDTALFFIAFARCANLRVLIDSSPFCLCLLEVHRRVVLELPPSDSCRNFVRAESLNGTWLAPSVSLMMQRPSLVRLKLIFAASFMVYPVAPVLLRRSEPAKSTKLSLAALRDPSAFTCW